MRQPHPESFYKHLSESTLDIMRAMSARASFAVPGTGGISNNPPGSALPWGSSTPTPLAARDNETRGLAALAVKMLELHASFAKRGVAGPRDSDGRSEPLLLAVKAAAAMLERCE
jgi:hypothetical protein